MTGELGGRRRLGGPEAPVLTSGCPCEAGGLFATIRADIDRYVYAIERDDLSRTVSLPRLLLSPRIWATVNYRLIHHCLLRMRPRLLGRLLAALGLVLERVTHTVSGIQITNHAHIGPGLQFTHEGGIVIGPVRMGRHCTISHGTTLGRGLVDDEAPSYSDTPVLGDRVWLGPGAVIAGNLAIGSDAAVGANSVVVRDVPPRAVVFGVPARLVSRTGSFGQVSYRGMADDPERAAARAVALIPAPPTAPPSENPTPTPKEAS